MNTDVLNDVIDISTIKPQNFKKVLKIIVNISIILIAGAFVIGSFKIKRINRLDNIEKTMYELKLNQMAGFDSINKRMDNINYRIDKVYSDGYKAFNDYQNFNKKQLGIIIDYGNTNKDLMKRMLDLNSEENNNEIKNNLNQAKTIPQTSISVNKIK